MSMNMSMSSMGSGSVTAATARVSSPSSSKLNQNHHDLSLNLNLNLNLQSSSSATPSSSPSSSLTHTLHHHPSPRHHPRATPSFAFHAPSPSRSPSKYMPPLTLSVEQPMRTVPSPAAASLSPVGPGTSAATSSADYSRTHGHSRQNSLAAARRPSNDANEKPRVASPSNTTGGDFIHHNHHPSPLHHQVRVPSPLAAPAHFPPAWSHHSYGGEAQCPPRSRPPVRQLFLHAIRERFSCKSKSGLLGRGLMIGWVITTLGFLAATAFWKGELFDGE